MDIDNFYPRCYDLSERNDFEDFLENFKTTKVISLLKEFSENSQNENFFDSQKQKQKIKICMEILKRKITEWNNPLLNRNSISDKEWTIVSEEDSNLYLKEQRNLERTNKISSQIKRRNTETISNLIDNEDNLNVNENKNKEFNKGISNANNDNDNINSNSNEIKDLCKFLLRKIKEIQLQYEIDGKKNIWIMKPSGLSRGRGIKCFANLNEILQFIKKNSNQYMMQKYIENPLLILGRKVKTLI